MSIIKEFLFYLRSGFSRHAEVDRISGEKQYPPFKKSIARLKPFFMRHLRKGAAGMGLILAASLLEFPKPILLKYLVDDVILSRHLELLAALLFILAGIAALEILAGLARNFYLARFEQDVVLDVQENLIGHALKLPKAFFDSSQTGYLMSRLSADVQGLNWFFSGSVVYLLENGIRFAGGIAFLFYLEWRLSLIVLALLPLIFIIARLFSHRTYALSHAGMEQHARVNSTFQEFLASMPLIKAFSSERRTLKNALEELRRSVQVALEQTSISSLAGVALQIIPGLARLSVLGAGAYWIVTDRWTLGSLLAYQAYLGYVFGPAQVLASANFEIQGARACLDRISAFLDAVPEDDTGREVKSLRGEIEFRGVSFSYNGADPVLRNASFRVRRGERIAVVGPSGAGKTTLISLLLRFYRPDGGEIYFDGEPASSLNPSSVRSRIGYVSQVPKLLRGTFMENLRLGNPDATEEQVIAAAKSAGIHDFIISHAQGYQAVIEEGGANLSEGQKQKLCLARALVRNPDILLLDEPAASMDSISEQSILSSLPDATLGITVFVAAHRLSTFRNSDRILLIDEGGCVTAGDHESLLSSSEYYRKIIKLQYGE